MPFIEEHYRSNPFVFWPDLATAHYAKSEQDYLKQPKVTFVLKEDNPAIIPEVRLIEDFWSYFKG